MSGPRRRDERIVPRAGKRAVILAAGRGVRLRPITDRIPKPLVAINGRSILDRQISLLEGLGVAEVLIVTGYRGAMLEKAATAQPREIRFSFVENPEWEDTNSAVSLALAGEFLAGGGYVVEGDGLFRDDVARRVRGAVLTSEAELLWVAARLEEPIDGCVLTAGVDQRLTSVRVLRVDEPSFPRPFLKSTGLLHLDRAGAAKLFALLTSHHEAYRTKYYDLVIADHLTGLDAFVFLIDGGEWAEVDTVDDLRHAEGAFS